MSCPLSLSWTLDMSLATLIPLQLRVLSQKNVLNYNEQSNDT